MRIEVCRCCGSPDLAAFLDLGNTPIADGLVSEAMLDEPDPLFPLQVVFCSGCALVQILETLPPKILFCRDYPYYSSVSDSWLAHSSRHAESLIRNRNLASGNLVVEVASNDGYLLRNFQERGIPVLGIDPASGPAEAARAIGVETLGEFFTSRLATELKDEGKQADVVIANNVLAHVPDTPDFVRGLQILTKPDGLISIEVPYVRDLVDRGEFDTIYHQHLCYFSLTALVSLFEFADLSINHVVHLKSHGGSLRIYAGHSRNVSSAVKELLKQERNVGLDQFSYFEKFAGRVYAIREGLLSCLDNLKRRGYSIAGYGAAAKACTLLNYCQIGAERLDYIADRNQRKLGWYMPGVRIPIFAPESLLETQPDYVLLLSWNLADEILAQQSAYRARGGKFIIPLPSLRIV